MDRELDPSPAGVQSVTCQADDVGEPMTAAGFGNFFGDGGPKPVNPSIATTATATRLSSGWSASQVLKGCLECSSTTSSRRAWPVPPRTGVRSTIPVTHSAPRLGVARHVLVDPITRAPSNPCSSSTDAPTRATPSTAKSLRIRTRSIDGRGFRTCGSSASGGGRRNGGRRMRTCHGPSHRSPDRSSPVDTQPLGGYAVLVAPYGRACRSPTSHWPIARPWRSEETTPG